MEDFNPLEPNQLINRFEEMRRLGKVYFFDVDDFEMIADYYMQNGKDQIALEALHIAIGQHSYSSELYVRRAQLFLDNLKLNSAKNDLDTAFSIDNDNPDAYIALAEWHSKKGQHNRSIQNLKKAAELLESYDEINHLLAQEYLEMANYKMAAEYFKKVLLEDYDDGSALFSLSFCYDMLGETKELIDFLKEYIDENPYSELAWHQLGLLYQKNRQYELAVEAFDYACLIDEYFSAAQYEKARAYELMGEYAKAISIYEDIMDIEDTNAYAYFRIGLALKEMGEGAKAVQYLKKALVEDPESEDILINLISIFEKNEQWREALYYNRKLLKITESTGVKLYIAYVFNLSGLVDESIDVLEELMQSDDVSAEVYFLYSEIMLDTENMDTAVNALLQGNIEFPENLEFKLRLGSIFYMYEMEDIAKKYFLESYLLNKDFTLDFFKQFPDGFHLLEEELN
jgi:tetratricopeptide (TPR) repeat protein